MTPGYLTLGGEGTSRYEEKKSVFLGFAGKATSEEDAIAAIAAVKASYPDAKHHVYAYRLLKNNLMRFSDDREPQGTAGMPTLDVLRQKDLYDCWICVVRYFGGTLLGTGGLVHAYGSAAQDAVLSAGIVRMREMRNFSLDVSYTDYPKVQAFLEKNGAKIADTSFSDRVAILASVADESFSALSASLFDATAGRVSAQPLDTVFTAVPVEPGK